MTDSADSYTSRCLAPMEGLPQRIHLVQAAREVLDVRFHRT